MGDGGGESYTRDAKILAETKKKKLSQVAPLLRHRDQSLISHGSPVMALLRQLSQMTVYCSVV